MARAGAGDSAAPTPAARMYTLLGADRRPYRSKEPGQFGGHRPCAVCLPGSYAAWLTRGSAAQAHRRGAK